jgi:hypothetical protein
MDDHISIEIHIAIQGVSEDVGKQLRLTRRMAFVDVARSVSPTMFPKAEAQVADSPF